MTPRAPRTSRWPEPSVRQIQDGSIRTIFAQPTPDTVRDAVGYVAETLDRQFPSVALLLRDAREEITAFADFPQAHWRNIWSTNPLERLNKEV